MPDLPPNRMLVGMTNICQKVASYATSPYWYDNDSFIQFKTDTASYLSDIIEK